MFYSKALAVALVVGFALVSGCGKKASEAITEKAMEKAIEKQSGGQAKVDLSKNKMTIKSKDGEFTVAGEGGAEVPKDFPKDVPVYKGAKVKMSMKQPKAFMLALETKDDMKKVTESYQASMKDQGWTEDTTVNSEKSCFLTYKKEKRQANVSISSGGEGTEISLTVTSEE